MVSRSGDADMPHRQLREIPFRRCALSYDLCCTLTPCRWRMPSQLQHRRVMSDTRRAASPVALLCSTRFVWPGACAAWCRVRLRHARPRPSSIHVHTSPSHCAQHTIRRADRRVSPKRREVRRWAPRAKVDAKIVQALAELLRPRDCLKHGPVRLCAVRARVAPTSDQRPASSSRKSACRRDITQCMLSEQYKNLFCAV
jgi:hypothetical protein